MFTIGEFSYVLKISFEPSCQLFIQHHRKSVKCSLTGHLLSLLGPIPFVLNPRTESGPPRKNLRKQKTYSQSIRFDRIEVKSVNRALPMLDRLRSRDSDQKECRLWERKCLVP